MVTTTRMTPESQIHLAKAWNRLGLQQADQGQLSDAIGSFEKSLAILKVLGDREEIASVHVNLGRTYKKLRNLDKACDHWREAASLYEEADITNMMAMILGLAYKAGCFPEPQPDDPGDEFSG